MSRVLIIAAHPDDEVLGVGGTIARHADQGDDVFICILSEGASAQYSDSNMVQIRREAARSAGKILGVSESYYHDLPDGGLEFVSHLETNAILEKHIKEIEPDIVYTHFAYDTDLDHRRTFESTIVSTRPKVDSSIKRVLSYEVPGQTHWSGPTMERSFNPNIFIEISGYLERKLKAMECYSTEIGEYPHARSLESIRTLAQFRGVISGVRAAEAYVLIRDTLKE